MTVVKYDAPMNGRGWVELMGPAVELARHVSDTEFVPRGLRGKPDAILAAIMYGNSVGLDPMQALAQIAVIDGKPSLSSESQRGLILAAGHEVWIDEATVTRVTVSGRRRDSEKTWTMDDAKRAGLSGKPSWRAYPRQMLLARATAELARITFADVIGGLVAIEELDADVVLDEADVVEDEPKPKRTRKRKRPAPESDSERQETSSEADTRETGTESASELPDATVNAPEGDEPDALADAARESQAEAEPMSEGQRKKMNALFREKDVSSRDARLAYCSTVARRKIASSLELNHAEADAVIDALTQWEPSDPASKPFPAHDPTSAPWPEGF
jgi:hypothetical protein